MGNNDTEFCEKLGLRLSLVLKIYFCDFWKGFNYHNYFYEICKLAFGEVIVSKHNPDIIFYSVFGGEHLKYNCKKIFYSGETISSKNYILSLTFNEDGEHNIRLPLWVIYLNWFKTPYSLQNNPAYLIPIEDILQKKHIKKEKFCNIICNNDTFPRKDFFNLLSNYRKVDSLGSLSNNTGKILGGNEKHKIEAQKDYKFTLAFENKIYDGYVTEKILHAFASGTVPVYYGTDCAKKDFNPKAFIHANDFSSLQELAEYIKEVDMSDDLYNKYISEPYFMNNCMPQEFVPETVSRKIKEKMKI